MLLTDHWVQTQTAAKKSGDCSAASRLLIHYLQRQLAHKNTKVNTERTNQEWHHTDIFSVVKVRSTCDPQPVYGITDSQGASEGFPPSRLSIHVSIHPSLPTHPSPP